MKINFVSRSDINIPRNGSSKYDPLLEAVKELEPGGKALETAYRDESELSSMRNVVYAYNRETDNRIKSKTHAEKNIVFFFIEE